MFIIQAGSEAVRQRLVLEKVGMSRVEMVSIKMASCCY